jgi:deoxyribodipyrimidine photolyase-like uncharacterized protein
VSARAARQDGRMARQRWVVAGQLGEEFDDGGRMLLVEARSAWSRAPIHRRKAHLYLSAMRHRKAELGDRMEYVQAATFRAALEDRDLEVIDPTSSSLVQSRVTPASASSPPESRSCRRARTAMPSPAFMS